MLCISWHCDARAIRFRSGKAEVEGARWICLNANGFAFETFRGGAPSTSPSTSPGPSTSPSTSFSTSPSYLLFYLPFYLPTRGNPGDFENLRRWRVKRNVDRNRLCLAASEPSTSSSDMPYAQQAHSCCHSLTSPPPSFSLSHVVVPPTHGSRSRLRFGIIPRQMGAWGCSRTQISPLFLQLVKQAETSSRLSSNYANAEVAFCAGRCRPRFDPVRALSARIM